VSLPRSPSNIKTLTKNRTLTTVVLAIAFFFFQTTSGWAIPWAFTGAAVPEKRVRAPFPLQSHILTEISVSFSRLQTLSSTPPPPPPPHWYWHWHWHWLASSYWHWCPIPKAQPHCDHLALGQRHRIPRSHRMVNGCVPVGPNTM
jgi:hypothetical protein